MNEELHLALQEMSPKCPTLLLWATYRKGNPL
jgi:hypothetical protein